MGRKKIPFSIFLDLSKAFDTLNHYILLTAVLWHTRRSLKLVSKLFNKTFAICPAQWYFITYKRNTETGVTHGSILAPPPPPPPPPPLLFIIYMNDIHTVSDEFSFILYADNTTLISPFCSFSLCSHNDMNYVSTMINLELTKISDDWLAINKRSLNAAKTKFMLFHNYQKLLMKMIYVIWQ